jgi:hypothetical protein
MKNPFIPFTKIVRTKALLLCLGFVLITACASTLTKPASLPAPSENVKSILIIPIETIKKYPSPAFGKYKLKLDEGKHTVMLDFGVDYVIVSGLEPGTHKIQSITFMYKAAAATGRERRLSIPFQLKPGYVNVLKHQFKFTLYRKGSSTYQRYDTVRLYPKDIRDILQILSKDKNFHLWKNDYDIE